MSQPISSSQRPNARKPALPHPIETPSHASPAAAVPPAAAAQPTAGAAMADRFVAERAAPQRAAQPSAEDAVLAARQSRRARRAAAAPQASAAPAGERTMTFEYDTGGRKELSDVQLKGSWNPQTGEHDPLWNGGAATRMHDDGTNGDRVAGDGIYTAQVRLKDDGSGRRFEWGVTVDGPAGDDRWAVMREGNLAFQLDGTTDRQHYAMTTDHKMGVHKLGEDGVSFRVWLPNVPSDARVSVELQTPAGAPASFRDPATGRPRALELTKDDKTGQWSIELPAGWKGLEGKVYQYKIERADLERPIKVKDPYSRYQQGQQRGVERVAIDEATGVERAWYWDAKDPGREWGQFRYSAPATADAVTMRIQDENGKAMDRAALERLMGNVPPEVAAQMPAHWKDRVAEDGSIRLEKRDGKWEADLFNFRGIQGLGYELQATRAGKSVQDVKGVLGDDLVQNRELVKLGYKDGANPKSDWARFEVPGHSDAERVTLTLMDGRGRQLTREQILARVGEADPKKRETMGNVWQDHVREDGTIELVRKNGGDWRTMIPSFDKLVGLKHELRVYKDLDGDGKADLVGDKNRDGRISAAERAGIAFNDPNDRILEDPSSSRLGTIRTDHFDWKHKDAPRMETDPHKFVLYEAHVGSFFSPEGHTKRSTFQDMIQNLDYLKELGVNTVQIMPANEFAGTREWGYTIVDFFSGESGYGFEDTDGRWVTGTEALKRFVDEAHGKGFNVFHDVVYNHVGDRDNALWKKGGPENPFFNWSQDGHETRDTPWGALPAYNQEQVRQFFVDHAVSQVEDLGFDGLRFDFTHKMHTTGGRDGWEMLRQINRTLQFVKPGVYTTAEEFPNTPAISDPIGPDLQGAGFDSQWNDPFHDRLLENVQYAAGGKKLDMDGLMQALVQHPGRTEPRDGITYVHSHDEVGNTGDWINRAADNYDGRAVPSDWAADQSRNTAGLVMLSSGKPMIWQGEEFLSNRDFRHGQPETWGNDWQWKSRPTAPEQLASYRHLASLPPERVQQDPAYQSLSPEERAFFGKYQAMGAEERERVDYDAKRWGTFRYYQDAIALRKSSPAFDADAEVHRVYTHNDNGIAAFTRKKDGEEFLVVTSFNKGDFTGYGMGLPAGRWQEVHNSDGGRYGGDNFGNFGGTIDGGAGARVNIPGGGLVVLKRVG
jgi:1,4-alpha-glucan branching enzyme